MDSECVRGPVLDATGNVAEFLIAYIAGNVRQRVPELDTLDFSNRWWDATSYQ